VRAPDPATFAAVAFMLALIAMVASYIPAPRTLRVDVLIVVGVSSLKSKPGLCQNLSHTSVTPW
jgi:hypothetical protein